ncbi:biotin--[acetyl-CoA-carboxylase] ligase [Phascolarctobacterium sp.]|uniref:biotin--[acetyl-CoA-carboxylase] ligase n=1 Tax=Phascolarctobacterium sp. TaxID=2049039 RepID=UPI00386F0826
MRKKILELLRASGNVPLSGEEISHQLEVSRTAIWKHIQTLKNEGYEIDSVPKKGYILKEAPNRLFPQEILSHLQTKWLGRSICYEDSVASTNNVAKLLANQGCENGLLVVAEEQSGGKGRLSRGWVSPHAKGIWFSVVLKPPFLPQEASKCTLLAAVAVVKAINKLAGVEAAIKWPNDILLMGRKLVGILTEMNAEFGHINYVVIGTGINTNTTVDDFPDEVKPLAVCVAEAAKEPFTRVQLLCDILQNMEDLYEQAVSEGFAPVLAEWRKYSCTLGQEVKVIAPDMTYFGQAVDIDDEGLLMVRKEDGTMEKVVAGDVSIRPAAAKNGAYA